MTTRLFLIRHGATELTAEDRFAGAIDVKLSEEGKEQARRLALRLAHEKISAIYASPMTRTIHTAELLAERHGLAVTHVDALREIAHGRWEGKRRVEVEAEYA